MKKIVLVIGGVGVASAIAAPAFADPVPMIDRPYALPAAKLSAYADVDYVGGSESVLGTTLDFNAQEIHVGGGYGLSNTLTVGAEYALIARDSFSASGMSQSQTFPGSGQGILSPYAMLQLVHTPQLSAAAVAALGINLCAQVTTDETTGNTSCTGDTLYQLTLGVDFKIKLTPSLAVFTGTPYGPGLLFGTAIGTTEASAGLGNQLAIGLNDSQQTTLDLAGGVELQAAPSLMLYGGVDLLHFRLANKGSADTVSVIGSDATMGGIGIPVIAGGFVSIPGLDLGLAVEFPDITNASDIYVIQAAARFTTN